MNIKSFLTILLLAFGLTASAKNTKTTVKQVTESVTVADDVDYTITEAEPFGTMGSVNITNLDHAVVIIEQLRPSVVKSKWLKNHVYINGTQAVDGKNCQVRMYNRGAIILPYASTLKPLTCYAEENFEGKSYNGYKEGHTGGFMNTLTTTMLLNNIRSFKLKRGYMVTFCVGTGGWGYSRCFIADQEDLEINVPHPLNGRISSYRLFKWYNASKAGVHHTGAAANAALRTTSCFDWGQGNNSLLPDVEWISHHIYEDWPSAAACGGVDQTCHMKTNNEPGNSADDHPQDVATVLGNWQNLMRTGMRLCSESSHDGSMGHLKAFIDSVDARGWRCDILDLHCYWDSGTFNSLTWYSDSYGKGRPIWISEWVWGASWNNNGAFASGRRNDDATYNGTKPILDLLNSNSRVERYFYWNSEAGFTNIYRDNKLTKLGEYYASMNAPLAYNAANEYIPKVVFHGPNSFNGKYYPASGKVTLTWKDPNGDMLDKIVVQCKGPKDARFNDIAEVKLLDKTSSGDCSYSYSTTCTEPGISEFKVVEYYTLNGKQRTYTTSVFSVSVSEPAKTVGLLQYGQIKAGDTEQIKTPITPMVDTEGNSFTTAMPYIVTGLISNKNTANGIVCNIPAVATGNFTFELKPWTLKTALSISNTESVDYLILPPDTVMHLTDDMMLISASAGSIKGDEVEVAFPEAFPEGTTPVVVAQQSTSSSTAAPAHVKVYDVTNTGFKCKLVRQEGITTALTAQTVCYFACSQGEARIGGGKKLCVGLNTETPIGGSARQTVAFTGKDGAKMTIVNPIIIAQPQTNNYGKTSVFRQHSLNTETVGEGEAAYNNVVSASIRRQVDDSNTSVTEANLASTNGDYLGYIILCDDLEGNPDDAPVIVRGDNTTAIRNVGLQKGFSVSTMGGCIYSDDTTVKVYNAAGQRVALGKKLPNGVYVVSNGKKSIKINVK